LIAELPKWHQRIDRLLIDSIPDFILHPKEAKLPRRAVASPQGDLRSQCGVKQGSLRQ
jgi:hypothetical protein